MHVVFLDLGVPRALPGSVDPCTAPHPATNDEKYRQGEELFQAGRIEEACTLFDEARLALETPHPNYAYYVACCRAKLGDRSAAVAALHQALRDGWRVSSSRTPRSFPKSSASERRRSRFPRRRHDRPHRPKLWLSQAMRTPLVFGR